MSKAGEVFGQRQGKNVLSYVERDVDREFKATLEGDEYSVMVIYGTSKQGKSSLLRRILPKENSTFISGASDTTYASLNREILSTNGVLQDVAVSEKSSRGRKTSGKVGLAKFFSAFLPISGSVSAEKSTQTENTQDWAFIDIDFANASSVARLYASKTSKPIVIDNFHYFDRDEQKKIATGIRAFEEHGIQFVILGTWVESNYLTQMNSDLAGRIMPLSIESWADADFNRVVDAGEKILNIEFRQRAREILIQKATGNIGLLQAALSAIVKDQDISETCQDKRQIETLSTVNEAYREISDYQLDDTFGQLKLIAELGGTREPWNKRTRMHYLVRAFIEDQGSGEVNGVPFSRLLDRANQLIQATVGADTLFDAEKAGSIRKILTSDLLRHQRDKLSTPIVLYDAGNERLRVIDSWVLLTLRNRRTELVRRFEDFDCDL